MAPSVNICWGWWRRHPHCGECTAVDSTGNFVLEEEKATNTVGDTIGWGEGGGTLV